MGSMEGKVEAKKGCQSLFPDFEMYDDRYFQFSYEYVDITIQNRKHAQGEPGNRKAGDCAFLTWGLSPCSMYVLPPEITPSITFK
jgi:hypothetical protein